MIMKDIPKVWLRVHRRLSMHILWSTALRTSPRHHLVLVRWRMRRPHRPILSDTHLHFVLDIGLNVRWMLVVSSSERWRHRLVGPVVVSSIASQVLWHGVLIPVPWAFDGHRYDLIVMWWDTLDLRLVSARLFGLVLVNIVIFALILSFVVIEHLIRLLIGVVSFKVLLLIDHFTSLRAARLAHAATKYARTLFHDVVILKIDLVC